MWDDNFVENAVDVKLLSKMCGRLSGWLPFDVYQLLFIVIAENISDPPHTLIRQMLNELTIDLVEKDLGLLFD